MRDEKSVFSNAPQEGMTRGILTSSFIPFERLRRLTAVAQTYSVLSFQNHTQPEFAETHWKDSLLGQDHRPQTLPRPKDF
jgi:hypothetical protein